MAERSQEIVEGCLDQVILDTVDLGHVQESKEDIEEGLFLTANQNSTPGTEGTTQPDLSNSHSLPGTLDSETILINYASRKQKLNDSEIQTTCKKESTREELPKSVTFPEELNKLQNNDAPKNGRSRPSLVEDSRLVRISLPTNPINLMQSNAQFLNKSRNFLNFITEKSTNIMEKTLLPQHIANKYGALNRNAEPNSKESPKTSVTNSPLRAVIESVTDCKEKRDESKEKRNESDETRSESEESKQNEVVILDETDSPLQNNLFSSSDEAQILGDVAPSELNARFLEKIRQLEEKNRALEIEKDELVVTKVRTLERTIEKLSGELKISSEKQEAMSKQVASVNKERESMVMKYATGEKQLINAQRTRDTAERKVKELSKDNEMLQAKLRQVQNERTKICSILDSKCNELVEQQKLAEKFKEEVSIKDVKLTWVQNKWKNEMEAHKETQQKLDKVNAKIAEMKEECELVRRESQESIRKFQVSEENKAVTLDHQLKEQQARLILERHVTEDKELLRIQLQKEVDTLKHRQEVLVEENNMLSLKNQELEKDRLNYDSNLGSLKILADQRQKEVVDLVAKVSELETLKLQLKHQEQCLSSTEAEVNRLRQKNEELQIDMDACRQREAHMLEFTQKLTDKNVRLQSEFTALESKNQRLERDQKPIREEVAELAAKVKCLEESLLEEKRKRTEDCEILAKHVAEQTQLAVNLKQQLEDSQGENAVLKRKHQLSLKEMARELHQYRKRLEAFETSSPSNSLDPMSRTGSNASLNAAETSNGASSDASNCGDNPIQTVESDRQALMDRIIKLQKINVKRAEKLDFLDEHCSSLMAELQKKTKIIQNYILHENFDVMGSNARDKHKAELARHGGIMASVYNHKVSDENMTLELSLEINQKLQTVLEDTLLKNITLKDNIDTLGEEIARLTMQNQQKKK